jgi:hypothetical protein
MKIELLERPKEGSVTATCLKILIFFLKFLSRVIITKSTYIIDILGYNGLFYASQALIP